MGRRGPAPTPTHILKLRGSPRANRRRNEPKPTLERPSCPSWIDDDAKRAWRHLIPLLEDMRVLTRIDRNALTRYCQFWSRWKKAEQFIQQHGESYPLKDDQGRIKCLQAFPQVATAHKLAAQLTRLEQEFGMTPSARTHIQASTRAQPYVSDPAKVRFFERPLPSPMTGSLRPAEPRR